jgi:4-oxalocrotonate tautomerase
MPLIQVKLIENVFTPEQKSQIIAKLTDAMVSIEGENMRSVTWVVIEEARSGEMGHGRAGYDHRRRTSFGCGKGRACTCGLAMSCGRWPQGRRSECNRRGPEVALRDARPAEQPNT